MASELGRQVEQLAADFNGQQSDYKIVPVYKGQYTETMTAALFAIRTGAAARDRAGQRDRDRHHDGGEGRDLSGATS